MMTAGLGSALTLETEANVTYYAFVDSFGRDGDFTLTSAWVRVRRVAYQSAVTSSAMRISTSSRTVTILRAPAARLPRTDQTLACDPNALISIDAWGTYIGDQSGAPSGESSTCGGQASRERVYAVLHQALGSCVSR